jgi:hypothetical protein
MQVAYHGLYLGVLALENMYIAIWQEWGANFQQQVEKEHKIRLIEQPADPVENVHKDNHHCPFAEWYLLRCPELRQRLVHE